MMYKNQFPKGRSMRGLALLPAIAIVLAAVNIPAVASLIAGAQNAEISLSSGKDSEKSVKINIPTAGNDNKEAASQQPVVSAVEQMPQPQGGMQGLLRFLGDNVHYPEEAMKAGVQGKAIVKFVVLPTGKVSSPEIVRSTGNQQLDAEALRVVASIPDFTPGILNGEPVACYYTLPINFSLKSDATPAAK